MTAQGSVSLLLAQLKEGDDSALAALHQRYWPGLVRLARARLHGAPVRGADEEDVAQSAFFGFYQSVRAGRVPELENRHQLLALLTTIVVHRAINAIQHARTQKAGGGRVDSLSSMSALLADDEATPLQQAALNDCFRHYMGALPEPMRAIAEWHLAGATHQEIACRMGCVTRTVIRKLERIREIWRELADQSGKRSGAFGRASGGACGASEPA